MLIDCDECQLQHSSACQECVVTYLLDLDEGGPVVVDLDTERALRSLEGAGLSPGSRYLPRDGSGG